MFDERNKILRSFYFVFIKFFGGLSMTGKVEFWRDHAMDKMIEDIVDIFNNVEGVHLVRLSGMTMRARKVSGKNDIPPEAIDAIIRKLRAAGIIKFDYIVKCPHCGEISYTIIYNEDFKQKPKLCDSCSSLYALLEGSTLENLKK